MSTDQTGHLIAEEAPPPVSPIENELPTYRAISTRAVFSVLCGALALFSYASLSFLIFAVLAVVLGVLAIRAIRRSPDTLTGTRLANVGITLGLVFGLTVATYTGIQNVVLRRSASSFARVYAQVLKEGSLGDALLYGEPPERRKDHSAADKEKDFEAMKAKDKMMLETRMAGMLNLRKSLTPKTAEIHFVDIEGQGVDESMVGGIYYFAAALYEIDGGAPITKSEKDAPEHRFAMALLKGKTKGRHIEWWVEDTRFPYARESYKPADKPVDDGHGHAH